MNRRQKSPPQSRTQAPAYRQAFERLDAALAKNPRSRANDIEKIDRLRLAVFGCLPDTVKIPG